MNAKIAKCLALATSALTIGNEHEASTAAARAGAIAFALNPNALTVDSRNLDPFVWSYVVDGYYDAKEGN